MTRTYTPYLTEPYKLWLHHAPEIVSDEPSVLMDIAAEMLINGSENGSLQITTLSGACRNVIYIMGTIEDTYGIPAHGIAIADYLDTDGHPIVLKPASTMVGESFDGRKIYHRKPATKVDIKWPQGNRIRYEVRVSGRVWGLFAYRQNAEAFQCDLGRGPSGIRSQLIETGGRL